MGAEAIRRNDAHIAEAIAELKALLGDRLSTAQAVLEQHGKDESYHPVMAPDAVAFAESTEEVSAIVKICAAHKVPMIPFGTGTSLEGGVAALQGGVTIDVSQMNHILEVNTADMDCRVQAGVTRKQLNEHLRDTGLFFPIDPGADASLGGMAATRASGTNAVRYGTMKDAVMALQVVLPDGSVIRTGGRARKSAAGYDLTRLFVGAEGTLGLITELTLRLHGIPEAISAASCTFPDIASAARAVIATVQYGLPVARIELLDALTVRAVNAHSRLSLPEAPLLLLEFHGSEAGVAEQAEAFGEIAAGEGGGGFAWTANTEERNRLWQARHDTYWACLALRPGAVGFSTDVCVPISRLAECIAAAQGRAEAEGLVAPIVGHAGDGNFHMLLLVDGESAEERGRAERFTGWLNELAIGMAGTCTGEHGIGQGKRRYLERELGPALGAMAAVKAALDPLGIMNPGKILG